MLKLLQGRPKPGSRKLIFLHSPKTGGMTLDSILPQLYPGRYALCKTPEAGEIRRLLGSVDCLRIHPTHIDGQLVFPHSELFRKENWDILENVDIFIMFRHPVDHILSLYAHYMRHRGLPGLKEELAEIGIEAPDTLDEFLSAPYGDPQLAFFVGETQMTGRGVDEQDLQRAKELMEHLNVTIGILERYGQSLASLERATGKRLPTRTIEVRNQNPNGPTAVDAATRDWILRRNRLDVALYEHALRRFERQIASDVREKPSAFTFQAAR
jgi:hypothetical protein